MAFNEFINSPIFDLPLKRDDRYFPDFLSDFFKSYIELLKNYNGEFSSEIESVVPVALELSRILNDSLNKYYLGKTSESYNLFSDGIVLIEKYLSIQKHTVVFPNAPDDFYYKARTSNDNPLDRSQMFIRCFEDREDIPTYRFSIPGLPCLYLSNNVYTVWKELNMQDINQLQISRFEIDTSLKRLFFAQNIYKYRILHIGNQRLNDKTIPTGLTDYLAYFPLHAACTIMVKNKNSVFKPEYIFPQFLMQWMIFNEIDMIEYMSTKINYSIYKNSMSFMRFNNIAIPAKSSKGSGVCEILKELIKVTNPISWQSLLIMNPKQTEQINENIPDKNLALKVERKLTGIEIVSGKTTPYSNSVFNSIEEYLINEMEAKYLV